MEQLSLLQGAGPGARYLVRRNLKQITADLLAEACLFQNSAQQKEQALAQLANLLSLAQETAQTQFTCIFRALLSLLHTSDEALVKKQALVCGRLLGSLTPNEVMVPSGLQVAQEGEQANNGHRAQAVFILMAEMLGTKQQLSDDHLDTLLQYCQKVEQLHNENSVLLGRLFELVQVVVPKEGGLKQNQVEILFNLLLTIESHPEQQMVIRNGCHNVLEAVAQAGGYADAGALHRQQIQRLMGSLMASQSYNHWTRLSAERFKFEVMVRNSSAAIEEYLEDILLVIERAVHPNNDIELRMDLLCLLEHILSQEALATALRQYSLSVVTRVLIPCARWKVGKSQIKMRKAAVINFLHVLDRQLISVEELHNSFKDLLPVIKTCLDDDWGPDLRIATVKQVKALLVYLHEVIDSEQLRELYPCLLERLDDSQDIIRLEVTKALIAFFACPQCKLSPSMVEYILKTLMIHLDDVNTEIQVAVEQVLCFAARVDPEQTLKQALHALDKMKHPRKCRELIALCENMLEAASSKYDEQQPD